MNPFEALNNIQDEYRRYVFSFQRFKNPIIRTWVNDKIKEGTLLWRDPYLQLTRNFKKGEQLQPMIEEGLLHNAIPTIFRDDKNSLPIRLFQHQSDAIRTILEKRKNTVVTASTGSGKSFCFGIPIVSVSMQMKEKGIEGIKAIIVYPLNALANSQYDDFAQRLNGTGLKIALYTSDTGTNPDEALMRYRERTDRDQPWDSEVLSREEIQANPPDILMTNYVMLDLIFSRFDDKSLFPPEHKGILKFLVLDEIHTYTGQRGADVACLIRRVKQRTGTVGNIRCIGTSATVQAGEGEDSKEIVATFAQRLFGESFEKDDVISEGYEERTVPAKSLFSEIPQITQSHIRNFTPTFESARKLLAALIGVSASDIATPAELAELFSQTRTFDFIVDVLEESSLSIEDLTEKYREEVRPGSTLLDCKNEIQATLLIGLVAFKKGKDKPTVVPKIHTFFSQGKTISGCLTGEELHLNERGEVLCPACAGRHIKRITFPLNFCRACGQEYYGATLEEDGTLVPRDIDTDVEKGESIYICPEPYNEEEQVFPEDWYTKKGNLKRRVEHSIPRSAEYCPECNRINPSDSECFGHQRLKVTIIPRPFLFCPTCGVYYDKRAREFNKLFTFGSVGRSTATDVLLTTVLEQLPKNQEKIIAFSDNRQDTALQAAHINNLQRRIHFRRGLYQALVKYGPLGIEDLGSKIFDIFDEADVMPRYSRSESMFIQDYSQENAYRDYLVYNVLQDLRAPQHKNQQNLEDVGMVKVTYMGIEKLAACDELWKQIPEIQSLSSPVREDLVRGFLDIFRKQQAIEHDSIVEYDRFKREKISKLNSECLFHVARYQRWSTGYSDTGDTRGARARVLRISSDRSRLVLWVKKVLEVDMDRAKEIAQNLVNLLAEKRVGYLITHRVKRCGDLYMIPAHIIVLEACKESTHTICQKCGAVYHFNRLNKCIESKCQDLEERDLLNNYFRGIYLKTFDEAVKVVAREHSGQVSGDVRREIEIEFKNPESPLNAIICTPTMELGIDIGILSAVYMRNVPPSPSNYAQRSGRAGRNDQPSIITTFCGIGSRRGPHDQYFYKFPERIIAGSITPPRFMLDNKKLIRTHLHSLILEEADVKLQAHPEKILDIEDTENERFSMTRDYKEKITQKVEEASIGITEAVKEAFSREMQEFTWFDEEFISSVIDNFVENLDSAFDYWRLEYGNLLREVNHINIMTLKRTPKKGERFRRDAILEKLDAMRTGQKDFYTYTYLRSQGFMPGYGFPTSYSTLSLSDTDDEITRDKVIALNEFAPGNTIYFSNQKYTIRRARFRKEEQMPVREPVLICPACASIFLGERAINLAACPGCGKSFETHHYNPNAMELPDMYGTRGERITSDEEERIRRGYNISHHYEKGSKVDQYVIRGDTSSFEITYEHNGRIVAINKGTRRSEEDGQDLGFVFCNACNEWLFGGSIDTHLEGGCSRNAAEDDIIRGIYLFTRDNHDVVTLDIPAPPKISPDQGEAFYYSVKEAILQGMQISLNIEEHEVRGMVIPNPKRDDEYRIVIFEKAEGGIGVVTALTNQERLKDIFARAREILHEGEENGCEKACYECLLSYYNQMEHELLDRRLALTFLDEYRSLRIEQKRDDGGLEELERKCDSDFERAVLKKIVELGLPLPDEAQKIVYDKTVPISKPDFFYLPNIAVFVDGPVHDKEYVERIDEEKRNKLRSLGYTVVSIREVKQVEDLGKYIER